MNYGDKMDEITLNIINEKADLTLEKLDELLELLTGIDSKVVEVLSKVNGLTPSSESSEPVSEVTSEFKTDLQAKIDEGLPYTQVKAWIIEKLYVLGIYSEEDIVIKLFTDVKGNLILEVKTRPYRYMGRLLQFLRDSMGEADKFETSRYSMNLIMWYELTKNQQMEEQTSDSSIIDAVNEDWEDRDDVNAHLG